MVSILIPTYNTAIEVLVDALYNQCKESGIVYEIIFCEDASTEFIDHNLSTTTDIEIIKISNPKNLGRTATRTKLAQTAQFDWLLFLDADVLPENERFISLYLEQMSNSYSIIVGGISYRATKPESNKMLRWKFGIKKESIAAEERMKNPYLFPSANLLIRKDVFFKCNEELDNAYGYDNIFGYKAKLEGIAILHINNPVRHLGLESNIIFKNKSLKAVETLVQAENKNLLPKDHTRLQQSYQKLNRTSGCGLFESLFLIFENSIERNVLSKNPSIFLFDLYRLHHYIKLKKNA